MIRPIGAWRPLLAVTVLFASSCGFGHSVERPDGSTLIENLGANRYVYRLTRLAKMPSQGAAAPIVGIAPPGAHELGMIEVTVSYGGGGGDGLRDSESEFYPTLARLAGEMGGTHFLVLRSTRENRLILGDWISSLTVDVLEAPLHDWEAPDKQRAY
jgi:hypothetical protein